MTQDKEKRLAITERECGNKLYKDGQLVEGRPNNR